ncbi:hypothetical protein ACH5RR_024236 [Cinchona calisaya]|uniref:RRM domain-containing protein n=1 Tax=Cinchona calisaya TaxID=153742 RepID=A0ABD2ZCY0_9GENT
MPDLEQKIAMTDNTEIDDRVDLDDDNYIEEDDNVEEQIEDEGAGEGADENGEDQVNQHENLRIGDSGKEQLFEGDRDNIGAVPVENLEKPNASNNAAHSDRHAELLGLPPHGSEIFIGGLPRDASEVDLSLRNLCKSIGEIFEMRVMKKKDAGESKGFAFVAFKTKDVAQKATTKSSGKILQHLSRFLTALAIFVI